MYPNNKLSQSHPTRRNRLVPVGAALFFLLAPLVPGSGAGADKDAAAATGEVLQNSEIRQFIEEMATQHNYPPEALRELFAKVHFMPELLERLSKPAEALPWHRYRTIFLTPERIGEGARFWHEHKETLARAEEIHGVPAKVIVAILGVETYFGQHKGKYPVLDSLVTLSFRNTMRTAFFRRELEQFLLLVNEEKILNAHELKGSYAGAMGLPQFISSSYRRYAVDFDEDGQRNLIESIPDAIGSAAHYLAEHGWQREGGIATPVAIGKTDVTDDLLMKRSGSEPHIAFSDLRARGVVGDNVITKERMKKIPDGEKVALISLETETGPAYWIGQQNFYVITRYNHSNLYAMAVYQLAEAIRKNYPPQK
uniref:Membrane-bound lytic murein transglycosylase B n=1 Tax=Candidatus Kentrum sp. DK TaxID=2126562 RepID=A0A450SR90_9GAMM|nr:MAG: membrane-bound lytic murein transglycosylase B [Candidatus Kentron sp. DK]